MRAITVLTMSGVLVAASLLAGPTSTAEASTAAAWPVAPAGPDFDGDGRADIVVGAGVIGSRADLAIVFGDGHRLVIPTPNPYPPGSVFGSALVTGDFDGDGFDDVAAGDLYDGPFDGESGGEYRGAVWVYPGGPYGQLGGDQSKPVLKLVPGADGLPGAATSGQNFGESLAAGDLNGDGVDDLAIGGRDTVRDLESAGGVTVVPGGKGGLTPASAYRIDEDSPGVPGVPEYDGVFGYRLAIGDVTGDGRNDLAVTALDQGRVWVFPKGRPAGSTSVTEGALKIAHAPSTGTSFGISLVVGDLTGDGRAEVVVGVPGAKIGTTVCGAVAILRGSAAGISAKQSQLVSQSSSKVVGVCELHDDWGDSLALGDVTGDRRPELVVGAHGESVGKLRNGGAYTVLRRSILGVTGPGSFSVTQNTAHVPDVAELRDDFGGHLALVDVNGDHRLDVLATAAHEARGPVVPGQLAVLLSTVSGRPATGSRQITGDSFTPALIWVGRSVAGPAS